MKLKDQISSQFQFEHVSIIATIDLLCLVEDDARIDVPPAKAEESQLAIILVENLLQKHVCFWVLSSRRGAQSH